MTKKNYMSVEKTSMSELADKLREKNSFKEAVAGYLNAIMFDRNNAKSYFGLGICYKHLENYPKAIKNLEKAAELDNTSYETYFELGVCHLLNGVP